VPAYVTPAFAVASSRYAGADVSVTVYVPPGLAPELARKLDVAATLAALERAAEGLRAADSDAAAAGAAEALARIHLHAPYAGARRTAPCAAACAGVVTDGELAAGRCACGRPLDDLTLTT
jgi:hypothetical protein